MNTKLREWVNGGAELADARGGEASGRGVRDMREDELGGRLTWGPWVQNKE